MIADSLAKGAPANTLINSYWLPTIGAAIEIEQNIPAKAIDALQTVSPYELGSPPELQLVGTLYPVYLRGQAYLLLRKGPEAVNEFQKLLDHPGIVLNFPFGALAHLQLGRAYAMAGDIAKAKAAYKDFLDLWKDADPDIPILKQVKTEYARLQ
jgi:eukaryotic-like serine/threonine-protein kinase